MQKTLRFCRRMAYRWGWIGVILGIVLSPFPQTTQAKPNPQSTDEEIVVRVWLPHVLYPDDAKATLDEEFAAFEAVSRVKLEVRPKFYAEADFVNNLALTSRVAPAAMPDLILLRRPDMVSAFQQNLLVPLDALDNWLPVNLEAMPENQVALGTIDGQFYGLPYLLIVQHILYSPEVFPQPPLALEDLLNSEATLIFSGVASQDYFINNLLLLQYIAAGGRFSDETGAPDLDEDLVLELLQFYQLAIERDIIGACGEDNEPCPLNYTSQRDYPPVFSINSKAIGLFDSSYYLQRPTRYRDLMVAAPPTLNGEATTLLGGWMWVLTSTDPAKQEATRNFIEWMLISDKMAHIAQELYLLPSQENALRLLPDDPNTVILRNLVRNAIFVPDDVRRDVAALALQSAFESVLNGADPVEATEAAISSLQP